MIEFIKNYWDNIFLALSAIAAWFTGRKIQASTNKEAEANAVGVELGNLKTVREVEKQLLEDMRANILELMRMLNEQEVVIRESRLLIARQIKQLEKCKSDCKL